MSKNIAFCQRSLISKVLSCVPQSKQIPSTFLFLPFLEMDLLLVHDNMELPSSLTIFPYRGMTSRLRIFTIVTFPSLPIFYTLPANCTELVLPRHSSTPMCIQFKYRQIDKLDYHCEKLDYNSNPRIKRTYGTTLRLRETQRTINGRRSDQ